MENSKIKSESVVERASNINTDSFEMLEKLGPLVLTRLGLMYNRWHDRNSKFQESERITFPTWVDNFDRVNMIFQENSSLKTTVVKLQTDIDELKSDIMEMKLSIKVQEAQEHDYQDEVHDQDHDHDEVNEKELLESMEKMETLLMLPEDVNVNVNLKVPKTEEEFDKIRKTIYSFNKKNYKLDKKAKTWGDGCSRISNKKSLVSWLESSFGEERGLGVSILEDFSVCVVDDCLVTVDRDFKGGIGIEAFWIPPSRYASVAEASTDWKSDYHKVADPRHEYSFKGSKWVPELSSDQTNKRARVF